MTLYTSVIELLFLIRGDLFAGIICFAVSRGYEQFAHGVHSPYMDLFFLVPLFCGIILLACFLCVPVCGIQNKKLRKLSGYFSTASAGPSVSSFFQIHEGTKKTGDPWILSRSFADGCTVADLSVLFFSSRLSAAFCCVGMFLTGVLKIAGTGSMFPEVLLFAGCLLFLNGIRRFLFIHIAAHRSDPPLRLSMPGRFQRRFRPLPKRIPQE